MSGDGDGNNEKKKAGKEKETLNHREKERLITAWEAITMSAAQIALVKLILIIVLDRIRSLAR